MNRFPYFRTGGGLRGAGQRKEGEATAVATGLPDRDGIPGTCAKIQVLLGCSFVAG